MNGHFENTITATISGTNSIVSLDYTFNIYVKHICYSAVLSAPQFDQNSYSFDLGATQELTFSPAVDNTFGGSCGAISYTFYFADTNQIVDRSVYTVDSTTNTITGTPTEASWVGTRTYKLRARNGSYGIIYSSEITIEILNNCPTTQLISPTQAVFLDMSAQVHKSSEQVFDHYHDSISESLGDGTGSDLCGLR